MSYKSHINDRILLEKTWCALQKAASKILNLIHKYMYNKHYIILMYIYFQYNQLFIFNLIMHII